MYLFKYISGIEVEKIMQYFRFYSVPAPWRAVGLHVPYLFTVIRWNFLKKAFKSNKQPFWDLNLSHYFATKNESHL